MDNLIGRRLGQYEITGVLGKGGMAVVYRARQTSIGRDVAIKIIKPDLAASKEFNARFQREARTTALLSHPHIRKLFDYGQDMDIVYFVSELVEGGTLAEILDQGLLPLEVTSRIMFQMASALDYAHERGVIHRDLKPANVLVDMRGNAFLTDFGLARLIADNLEITQASAAIGTPPYMAPEQWKGDPADTSSDNYGLAIILYEMLTGRPPFTGDTQYDLMRKHLYDQPPGIRNTRHDLPTELDGLFQRALAKEQNRRFESAMAMANAFQTILQEAGLLSVLASDRATPFPFQPQTETSAAQKKLFIISPTQAAEQERMIIQQIEADKQINQRTTPIYQRVVNTLPQDVTGRYVGRLTEQANIMALLATRARLISIYGRSGIGKTALVSKVLGDLQLRSDSTRPDGMVYLSTTGTGIKLERIFQDFGKLLGGTVAAELGALVSNKEIGVAQKVVLMLEKLGAGHYILLLDNLETLQDGATGKLVDSDLETFLEVAIEQGGSLSILVTSREPLSLPRALKTWERLIPLEDGLTTEDSVALLKVFDPDGAAGLQSAADTLLQIIAEKTHGYPRAIEAIAGLLLEDPLLSVDELINDSGLLAGEVTPVVVQQAIARLNPEALRIMEVLAVLERPVPQTAIEFLLAPYVDTLALRTILARLVKSYFVSFNKQSQDFALHPMDRDYCYSRIPAGSPDDRAINPVPYTQNALHFRAAEYFRHQRKPDDQIRNVDDLSPQLAEAEHLMKAGDFDAATELLLTFGDSYLNI